MYKTIHFLPLFLLSLLAATSCQSDKPGSLKTISYESCLASKRAMHLSDIADTLIYLELKAPEDIVASRVWKVRWIDDRWIVHSIAGVMAFSEDGTYLTTYGRKGGGPGEYTMDNDFEVDTEKKEVIMLDSHQLIYYDLDGHYLRSTNCGEHISKIGISHSVVWGCTLSHRTTRDRAVAFDAQGDSLTSIPNPFYMAPCIDAGMGVSTSKYWESFHTYQDMLYMKTKEDNDTLYQIQGEKAIPYLLFDMGKYKHPMELQAWYCYEDFLHKAYKYWGILSVLADERYYYLTAQRCTDPDGEIFKHKESNFHYILYDKELDEGFVTDGPEGTRFTDDYLGGPAFWPRWDAGAYFVSTIEWYDLKQLINEEKLTLSPDLQKQYDRWDDDTNALIILARKKHK